MLIANSTHVNTMTTISLDKGLLISGLLGGSLITSAVIAMNVGISKPISMALFTAGWFLIAKSFKNHKMRGSGDNNTMLVASVIVWISAITLRMMMDSNVNGAPMMMFGMLFMGGWLTIGSKVSDNTLYGLTVPMLIFSSMASINGFERPKSIASGPGVFLFSTAWVVLTLLNSQIHLVL